MNRGLSHQSLFGMVVSAEGQYCLAEVRKANPLVIVSRQNWMPHNRLKRFLLLQKGVRLGLPTVWKSSLAFVNNEELETITANEHYCAGCVQADREYHEIALAQNLLGIHSEDVFLATIPQNCDPDAAQSFVALYKEPESYRIGIVEAGRLVVAFTMAPALPERLPGHLARIERYWNLQQRASAFPSTLYIIGPGADIADDFFAHPPVRISLGESFDAEPLWYKAAGVALSEEQQPLGVFARQTPQAHFRVVRTQAYALSAAIIVLSVLGSLGALGGSWFCAQRYERARAAYDARVVNDPRIVALSREVQGSAARIHQLHTTFRQGTRWAALCNAVGQLKTTGLYVDRLGTQLEAVTPNQAPLALTGWAQSRDAITEFVSRLERLAFVTQVQLAYIQRDPGNQNILRYKVLCTLNHSNK